MNNKVLINLDVPEIDYSFDLYIPVNELVWKICKLIIKSVSDLTGTELNVNESYILINKINNKIYSSNEIILDTDIRNGTELLLVKQNKMN